MRPRADSTPGDGYDASEGPLETGLASESVALADIIQTAQADRETLAVGPEELGSWALREAAQQDEISELANPLATEEEAFDEGDALDELDEEDVGNQADSDPDSAEESPLEAAAVDLTDNNIREGSIFDQPSDEPGEVRAPLIKTNEADETLARNQRAERARTRR